MDRAPRHSAMVEMMPAAEVSEETFSSDGTSDIITVNLPIGTKLYIIRADQVLAPRRLLEAIEKTWRIPHPKAAPFNELGERMIEEGLHELRALLQR